MGMLDQMLANLYKPAKQEKLPVPSGKIADSAAALAALRSGKAIPTTVTQGQFLRGEVMDLRAGQILVLLENGAMVSARTEGTLQLSIGENARFFVSQTNEDQIVLKHVREEGESENPIIDKALTAAGITRTEKSVAIVTELLSHSQPVTEGNIRHYLSLSSKYPDFPVKDFILMELHQIPVTKETIAQFADYHDGNGKLLTQAATIIEELSAQIEHLPEGPAKTQLLQEFSQLLTAGHTTEDSFPKTQIVTERQLLQTQTPTPVGEQILPAQSTLREQIPQVQTVQSQSSEQTLQTQAVQQEQLQTGQQLSSPEEAPPPVFPKTTDAIPTSETPNALQSSSVATTLNTKGSSPALPSFQAFLDSFLLTPEEVANPEKVKEYYEALNQKLATLEQFAVKLAQTTKETESTAPKQMKSNLSFMESVNQVFPFLQLPLKFKETPAHGELYVYERKKALKPSDTFSALLHLDMEALGSMDVMITLAARNVTARFSMTKASSAELIRTELPQLCEALAGKGYTLQSDVTVQEPKEKDSPAPTLLEQFLEEHAPGGLSRYSFDIRA